VHPAVTVPSCF